LAEDTREWSEARSKPITVTYSDPRRYTGDAKKLHNIMKSKCPTATVTMASKAKYKGWAASAYGAENRVVLYSKLNKNRKDFNRFFEYIAKHECGHILTHNAAQKSGVKDVSARLNKLFGTKGNVGVERMADAVSNAWGASSKYNYDGKKMTSKQLVAAKKIMAGKWY